MTSPLMSRMMFAFKAGLQYGGRRDLFQVFGYPRALTAPLLYAKYQRQDIVSRIVEMPAEEMWSELPTLDEKSPIRTKWEEFAEASQLLSRIVQADKMCCFGPFAIMVLGLPGELSSPARPIKSLDDILYCEVYGGDSVTIKEYNTNPRTSDFGRPAMYQIQTGANAMGQLGFGATGSVGSPNTYKDVHPSRVIHIVDRPVQGQLFSEPRLAKVYNILEDMAKIAGGSAELYWILGNRGMQVDVDKEMDLDPDDAAKLTDELDEFQHGLRRYLRTRGVTIKNLGADTADPRGVFEVTISLLAAATGIPQRILMGAEAGQLASEQDRANWAELIRRRRNSFGVPFVLQPTLRKLGELGYLDKTSWVKAGIKAWTWPEAFHMNPVEQANAINAQARALVNISRRNQFGNPVISDEEAREMLGFQRDKPKNETFPEAPVQPSAGPQTEPNNPGQRTGTSETPSQIARNAAAVAIDAAIETDKLRRNSKTVVSFRASRDQQTGEVVGEIIKSPVQKPVEKEGNK